MVFTIVLLELRMGTSIDARLQGRREGGTRGTCPPPPPPGNSHAEQNLGFFWLTHYCNGY